MQATRKMKCEYCGNNQVPHFINWYFESLNVLFGPIRQAVLKNSLSRQLGNLAKKADFALRTVRLLAFLGVVSYNYEKEKCKVARARVLWEEMSARGGTMAELLLFGRPFDAYIAKKESEGKTKEIFFSGLPRPESSSAYRVDLMDDKADLKEILSRAGLPVPKGGSAWNFSQAKKIFDGIQADGSSGRVPVIVKPRLGSRGRHSTTYIYTVKDLKKAFKIAKQLCFWVIVEEMIEGPVYRATVINYRLAGVLRGDSPKVIGDGILSVRRLVKQRNDSEHAGSKDMVLDGSSEKFILRQIFDTKFLESGQSSLDYVPKLGETISLSEKIGVNYGGSSSEEILLTHPDNREMFEKAARVVDDAVIGFDYIIPDITKSHKGQKSGFLEANSLPFINLHHDPLYGAPQNVAAKVWDMMEN